MTLIPKNWQSFQHYNKRNPPWIKLHKGLLDDCDFQCLPVASRALAPMLWLLASEDKNGEIKLSLPQLAFRLRCGLSDLTDALKPLVSGGFFSDASNTLATRYQDAIPETETETETEEEEVQSKASSPSAPEVLPLKVAKEKKPRKVQTTALKGEGSIEAFTAIWEAFPRTKREWSQVTREYADVPVAPGSRLEGENNFQAIVDSGVCKPNMLYFAFWAYLQESPKVKDGFIQQVSTFFGPKKATYLEWLERAEFYRAKAFGVAQ